MSNEIEKHQGQIERAWNGRAIRTSKAELSQALAPIFATFPGLEMKPETFNAYYMMLCDLDANKLAVAVLQACQAHEYPTQLVTVAAIRKAYDGEQRAPGPRSDVDPHTLKPVPQRMFRLDPDEDRRQRMAQLKRTQKWDKLYQ
jgi:hypothetical protein